MQEVQKSRKIDIFPTGLTHGFGPKMALVIMNLVAFILTFVELFLPIIISLLLAKLNKNYTATTNEMIKIESRVKISAAVF